MLIAANVLQAACSTPPPSPPPPTATPPSWLPSLMPSASKNILWQKTGQIITWMKCFGGGGGVCSHMCSLSVEWGGVSAAITARSSIMELLYWGPSDWFPVPFEPPPSGLSAFLHVKSAFITLPASANRLLRPNGSSRFTSALVKTCVVLFDVTIKRYRRGSTPSARAGASKLPLFPERLTG